jgi:hypothetical protein
LRFYFIFSVATSQTNGDLHEDDDDSRVMNNLMSDIHAGFVQRRLPDGGFKVSNRTGRQSDS